MNFKTLRLGMLAVAGLAAMAAAMAATPERVRRLEAGLMDDPGSAERQARAEIDAATARGDAALRFEATLRYALAAQAMEHNGEARRAAASVRGEAGSRPDPVALCLLASIPDGPDDGRDSATLARLQGELARARAQAAGWCVARLQGAIGQILDRRVQLAEAIDALQDSLRLYTQEADAAAVASVQASLSWLYGRQSDSPQGMAHAIEHGQAAVDAAERLGLRSLASIAHHNLAGPYQRSGQLDLAHTHLARALELAQGIGDITGAAYIARLQARLEEQRGRPQAALALFDSAQATFEANGDELMNLVCRLGRLRVLASLSRWPGVQAGLPAVESLLQRVKDNESKVMFHELAMRLKEAQGDTAGALAQSKAWAAAIRDAHREENRRLAAEAQERNESARKEAENLRLREQQAASRTRQQLLLVTLALALALVAVLVVHGLRQRRLRTRLRALAERDELTGLPNRRAMLEQAQRRVEAARRQAQALAVALLDIDHFKSVNDRYGHAVGDAALRAFAEACSRTLRGEDMLGRIGGEEFLGVFPDTTPEGLARIFQRIREELQRSPVPGMPPGERLRFSMGADFLKDGDELGALVGRADAALYKAKAEGRDRIEVTLAPPPRNPSPALALQQKP